ncbi:MAG: DUF421 domain-containing protein, partial [Oscillospiraceae bacterium]|nr:DUF421 domain-containing protein [Oscillospiraceae bacterium]
ISEVQLAVVETTGTLSVYQKYSARNVTNGDMELKGKDENPPEVVVADGELVPEAMGRLGITQKWIEAALKKEKAAIKDVYLMTAYPGGKCSIIRKD